MTESVLRIAQLVKNDTIYILTPQLATIYRMTREEIEKVGEYVSKLYVDSRLKEKVPIKVKLKKGD